MFLQIQIYIFYSTLSYSVCLTLVLSGNYTAKCCFIFIILCVKLVNWHILLCLNCAKKGGKTISWNFSVTFVFLTLSGSSLLVHGHFLGFFLHMQLWPQMFRAYAGHGPFRFSPCFLFQLGLSAFWGYFFFKLFFSSSFFFAFMQYLKWFFSIHLKFGCHTTLKQCISSATSYQIGFSFLQPYNTIGIIWF